MFNFLDRVREKPRHKRQQFAFIIALLVTLVIVVVWVISFRTTISSLSIPSAASVGDTASGRDPSFGAKADFQQIIDTAESFGGLNAGELGENLPDDIKNLFQQNIDENSSDEQEELIQKSQKTEPRRVLIATTSSENNE